MLRQCNLEHFRDTAFVQIDYFHSLLLAESWNGRWDFRRGQLRGDLRGLKLLFNNDYERGDRRECWRWIRGINSFINNTIQPFIDTNKDF